LFSFKCEAESVKKNKEGRFTFYYINLVTKDWNYKLTSNDHIFTFFLFHGVFSYSMNAFTWLLCSIKIKMDKIKKL